MCLKEKARGDNGKMTTAENAKRGIRWKLLEKTIATGTSVTCLVVNEIQGSYHNR